uniref:Transcription factor STP1 n=1 Tax=Nakaseomyces delphensis TaxID=51657 RepID=A7WPH1_NAKDE|nr:transcription factor [Nakaseomyces delphensis]
MMSASRGSAMSESSMVKGTRIIPSKFQEVSKSAAAAAATDLTRRQPCNPTVEPEEYICHYCDARFKIRGYMTRHIKKHALQKAYYCPYYNENAPPDLRCHNNGGFSRRDTYKAHMKTRHIIYPAGVKSSERFKSRGHCSHCGEFSPNVEHWVEDHVESGQCTALPEEYVQTRTQRKKTDKKVNRVKMIKTSNGKSRFISTTRSIMDSKVLLNKDAMEALTIVAEHTNRSDILTKYGNNKILLDSADFDKDILESKPKNRYQEEDLEEDLDDEEAHPQFGVKQLPSNKSPILKEEQDNKASSHEKSPDEEKIVPLDMEQSSYDLSYLLEFDAVSHAPGTKKELLLPFDRDFISKLSQKNLQDCSDIYNDFIRTP